MTERLTYTRDGRGLQYLNAWFGQAFRARPTGPIPMRRGTVRVPRWRVSRIRSLLGSPDATGRTLGGGFNSPAPALPGSPHIPGKPHSCQRLAGRLSGRSSERGVHGQFRRFS
jgi:hypothetical protein